MEQFFIYSEVPLEKLKFSVNRPPSWYDEHPEFIEMRDKLIEEFKTIGINNPLSCVDNRDGTFTVTVGNQRLEALKHGGFKTAPCIISFLGFNKFIPQDGIEVNKTDIQKYFKSGIKRIVWRHPIFQVVPDDTDKYDPHKQ